jgi:hypothetical protein
MKARINRKVAVAGAGLALVAGGSGAYAATHASGPPTPQQAQQARQAFLDDLAKRLGVSSSALTSALKGALSDQVDAAVSAGRLTQAQGDKLKAAIQSGQAPFFGLPGLGLGGVGFGGPGFGGPGGRIVRGGFGAGLSTIATYLGITQAQLRSELASGKSLAQIASAHGKDASGLVDAIVNAETTKLDQAVKDGKLTQAQESQIVSTLKSRVTALVQNTAPAFGGKPWGGPPPAQPAA